MKTEKRKGRKRGKRHDSEFPRKKQFPLPQIFVLITPPDCVHCRPLLRAVDAVAGRVRRPRHAHPLRGGGRQGGVGGGEGEAAQEGLV